MYTILREGRYLLYMSTFLLLSSRIHSSQFCPDNENWMPFFMQISPLTGEIKILVWLTWIKSLGISMSKLLNTTCAVALWRMKIQLSSSARLCNCALWPAKRCWRGWRCRWRWRSGGGGGGGVGNYVRRQSAGDNQSQTFFRCRQPAFSSLQSGQITHTHTLYHHQQWRSSQPDIDDLA